MTPISSARANRSGLFYGLGERQDRDRPRTLERAKLRAEPEPVMGIERKGRDDQVVVRLRGMKQGFARLGLDVDHVFAGEQCGHVLA